VSTALASNVKVAEEAVLQKKGSQLSGKESEARKLKPGPTTLPVPCHVPVEPLLVDSFPINDSEPKSVEFKLMSTSVKVPDELEFNELNLLKVTSVDSVLLTDWDPVVAFEVTLRGPDEREKVSV
jgi:hypothetical protein